MDKRSYLEKGINELLINELEKLKDVKDEVEELINADEIDIELKAIRVFEEMQKIKFNSSILRRIKEMKE